MRAIKAKIKPLMDMTQEEQASFWSLVREQLVKGGKVVLGVERCPICGEELGPAFESRKEGSGRVGLILNLCDHCWWKYHASLRRN